MQSLFICWETDGEFLDVPGLQTPCGRRTTEFQESCGPTRYAFVSELFYAPHPLWRASTLLHFRDAPRRVEYMPSLHPPVFPFRSRFDCLALRAGAETCGLGVTCWYAGVLGLQRSWQLVGGSPMFASGNI